MTLPAHLQAPPVRELMRRLRKHAPLTAPVRLVQKAGVKCMGQDVLGVAAWRARKGKALSFRITIDSRLSLGEKFDVIVHEWAHCLDRCTRARHDRNPHDGRWGQAYARAFRASMTRD